MEKFDSRTDIRNHAKYNVNHEEGFLCPYPFCGKRLKSKQGLEYHENIHCRTKEVECPDCEKVFAHKETMRHHIKYMHSKTPLRELKCDYCDKIFTQKSYLLSHINVHTKPFECDTCLKKFSHKNLLQAHLFKCQLKEMPFKCEICGKGFESKGIADVCVKLIMIVMPLRTTIS